MPTPRIDAHHHLWQYSHEQYPWMSENMGTLRQDYLVDDLRDVLQYSGIDCAVAVQARQTLEETEWLLDLADRSPFMRGVIGWVPLVDDHVRDHVEKLFDRKKLVAVRHVLHDEADDFYMLRKDFDLGVGVLKEFDLSYDILIFERHLPQTINFVDRHPRQTFVLDHIAKPRIKDGLLSPWRENMFELAKRRNVYCKLSGMVTEADWKTWTEADLQPYFDIAVEAFGPERLMFGSDWPVVLVACAYKRWVDTVQRLVSSLSMNEQASIFGGSAKEAYHL
jgi:L-fuconolactonase